MEIKDVPGVLIVKAETRDKAYSLIENFHINNEFKHFDGTIVCLSNKESIEQLTDEELSIMGFKRITDK